MKIRIYADPGEAGMCMAGHAKQLMLSTISGLTDDDVYVGPPAHAVSLGLTVDSRSIRAATEDLNKFREAAERACAAVDALNDKRAQ